MVREDLAVLQSCNRVASTFRACIDIILLVQQQPLLAPLANMCVCLCVCVPQWCISTTEEIVSGDTQYSDMVSDLLQSLHDATDVTMSECRRLWPCEIGLEPLCRL